MLTLPSTLVVLDTAALDALDALVMALVDCVGIELDPVEEAAMVVVAAPLVDDEDATEEVLVADALLKVEEIVLVAVKSRTYKLNSIVVFHKTPLLTVARC